MSDPQQVDAKRLFFRFTNLCFADGNPAGRSDEAELKLVRIFLREASELTPSLVSEWSPQQQLALYEILRDKVIFLTLNPTVSIPPGELEGSSAERLAQPLLTGLSM